MLSKVVLYLDPGSGSMLFSAIVGILASLYFILKGLFFKLRDLPARFSNKKSRIRQRQGIVFYSEGGQYWNIFYPVIRELDRRGIDCTYLTSKEDDEGLACGLDHVTARYIGEGNKAFFVLNTLEADVCVMTTPGLDVLQLKRSKGVKSYIHIPHSAGGCSGYATYGVDYYDVFLSGGEGDRDMVQNLERVRQLAPKQFEIIGCTYLDILREKLAHTEPTPMFAEGRTTILLSPTWGIHGLLRKSGMEILSNLSASDAYNIIVRPHPQAFVSDKDVIEKLTKAFPDSDTLKWDRNPDGLHSMRQADIMISDFSGIIFDFLFLFEKPVLSFKGHYDKRGHDAMDLDEDPWNLRVLGKTGLSIDHDNIDALTLRVEELLGNENSIAPFLTELHNGMDKYPGESGVRGADAILNVLDNAGALKPQPLEKS